MSDGSAYSIEQITLDGDKADGARERPSTIRYCADCDEDVLRGHRLREDHEVHDTQGDYEATRHEEGPGSLPDEENGEEDPDERMGAWYDVTISVSTEYRFRIPAWSENEAKDLADEWWWDATPADSFVMHTETRELDPITRSDVPDGFDPMAGDLLYEVFEDA